ncbi:MAG: dihydropteroate synthase [Acidimicrobiia bacterium]
MGLPLARPAVMGVVNITPDSFSDGGRFFDHADAIAHGFTLVAQGADVIDVGGESTRPGAAPVDETEELRRVLPVIEALAGAVRVSIDTRHESVARAAVDAGASLINDISASLWPVAADLGVGWIAMHMQGTPATMQQSPYYDDVVRDVTDFLVERANRALEAGVDEVWIDPGIGFGKTLAHNMALLAHVDRLVATGLPVVVGTSRKAFLGRLLAVSDARPLPGLGGPSVDVVEPVPAEDRIEASLATETWAVMNGVRMIRVHDVAEAVQLARLVTAA